MRISSTSSRNGSSLSRRKSKQLAQAPALPAVARVRSAINSVVENLESRVFLSANGGGFTAGFYGAYYTTVAAFPTLGNTSVNSGDYITHMDTINYTAGNQGIAPADAVSNFNHNQSGGPGDNFSGHFQTHISVTSSGYYTFYPNTDDGSEITVTGGDSNVNIVGNNYLPNGQGTNNNPPYNEGQNLVANLPASTTPYTFDMYYNNGGGGWGYQLRWSATSGNGSGNTLIAYSAPTEPTGSFMSGTGVAGVATLVGDVPTIAVPASTINEVNATDTSITLSWSSHDVDAASYIIERSTDDATFTPVGTVTSAGGGTNYFIDTGLTASSSYTYGIVSNSQLGYTTLGVPTTASPNNGVLYFNGTNEPGTISPNVTDISTQASDTGVPAPTNITATPSSGGNVITFSQGADTNAVSYNILKATGTANGTYTQIGNLPYTSNSTSYTFTDTGNNANSIYEVQAVDSDGATATSAPVSLGHGDGFGAAYYTYDFLSGGGYSGSSPYVPNTTPSYSTIIPTINTNGGLGQGNRPAYTPTSFNSGQGNGQGDAFSTEFDFTVVAPYSESFTFIPRSDDGTQLTVDGAVIETSGYQGATNDPSSAVSWTAGTTHTIQMAYDQGGGGWETDLGWTSPTLAALNPGGFYGLNGQVVPGSDAYALGVQPGAAANPPIYADAPVASIAAFNSNNVTVSWTSSEADKYYVYEGTSPGGESATPVGTVTGTPGTQPGTANYIYQTANATQGNTYYFTVAPVNLNGTGTLSNEVTYTPTAAAPAAATNVTATPAQFLPGSENPLHLGGTTPTAAPAVTVAWTAPLYATNYVIERSTNGGSYASIGSVGNVSSYVDNTTLLNNKYNYEVIANDTLTGPTSAPSPTLNLGQFVLEQFYGPNDQNWGGASDNGATSFSGLPGTPNTSSIQSQINYNLGDGTLPPGGNYLNADNYSTIWTGRVAIATTGTYTFSAATDDDGLLYVGGKLVSAHGYNFNSNTNNGTLLTLTGGQSYDFTLFQEQGGGGHGAVFYYAGPDTGGNNIIVPNTALLLPTTPAAPTNVTATAGMPLNAASTSVPVTISFTNNADNAFSNQVEISTSPTGPFSPIGTPQPSYPSYITAGATDTYVINAPAGQTSYFEVNANNFWGATPSAVSNSVVIPAPTAANGVIVNYYGNAQQGLNGNDEWWGTNNGNRANTSNAVTSGIGTNFSTTTMVGESAEVAVLSNINYLGGSDGSTGTIITNTTNNAKYPDPAGTIGPDTFSAVMTGTLAITSAGTYSFVANTDDDGYLYINDQLVATYPGGHGANGSYNGGGETNTPIVLAANSENDVEFFVSNGGGGWAWQMSYAGTDTGGNMTPVLSPQLLTTSNPLVTPTGLTASATGNNITLTWNENNTSALRYVLERSASPTFSSPTIIDDGLPNTFAPDTTQSYTDTVGATPGVTYYYEVEAQNYTGTSSFSTAASATVQIPVVADQDVNGNIQVGFTAAQGATGYTVSRSVNGGGLVQVATLTSSQTSYTDAASGLVTGDTYAYQIVANGISNVSGTSNTLLYVSGNNVVNQPTGFAGDTGLQLNGGSGSNYTAAINGSQLELTNNTGNDATSAFTSNTIAVGNDLESSFDFQLANPGADGFTMILTNNANTTVGAGGGGLGYTGQFGSSIGVAFNMYPGVSQVALAENGSIGTYQNIPGNPFQNGNNDTYQVSVAIDGRSDAAGSKVYVGVRDETTGQGYGTTLTLAAGALNSAGLLNSADYIGFTGGTGGATSSQFINDWTVTTPTVPTVTGVSPNSDIAPGGLETVTVTGTNFYGTPTVDFGTQAGSSVHVNSPTQLTVVDPAQSAGPVNVTVSDFGGTSATSSADTFSYLYGTTTQIVAAGATTVPPTSPVSFTVQVSGNDPNTSTDNEVVTLEDASNGNVSVGTGTLSGGQATATIPANTLSAGNHNIIAVYPGDTVNSTSTSTPVQITVQVSATAPTLSSEVLGDGTNQRSTIYQMTVTFSEPVNFSESSYTLYQEPTNPNGSINLSGTPIAVGGAGAATSGTTATSSDNTTWTISVIKGGNLDRSSTAVAGQTNAGVLNNGIYQLVLNGSAITDHASSSAQFNSGNPQIVQYYSPEVNGQTGGTSNYFHTLYGDTNGDGSIDLTDYRVFKTAYGTGTGDSNFNFGLDSNGDGQIDLTDYRAFKTSYGQSYAY